MLRREAGAPARAAMMRLIVSAVVLTGAGASDSGNGKPAIKLPYHYKHPGRLDPSVFSGATNPDWQRRTRKLVAAAEMMLPLFTGDGSAVVSPGDFGGDNYWRQYCRTRRRRQRSVARRAADIDGRCNSILNGCI